MEKNFIRISKLRNWRKPSYLGRLPDHYYKHRRELEKPPTIGSVGYDEKVNNKFLDYDFADRRSGRVERKPFTYIPVERAAESDYGLWSGEGIVKGFVKPEKKIRELKEHVDHKVWFPKLIRSVLYSDILDDYFKVVITYRTKDAINEAKGFDFYILKTPVQDLKSQFGLDLRREMLIKLAKKDYYPNDPEKFRIIEEKYKEFVIPLEEAEWFGLSLKAAVAKQNEIDLKSKQLMPLKVLYAQNLINELTELKRIDEKAFQELKKEITKEPDTFKNRLISNVSSTFRKPKTVIDNLSSNLSSLLKKK